MFRKVLIANRGEIALRVIRACHELGIKTVAVYSEADVRAPHVREADEAGLIGPPPSTESYLRGEKIIEVAKMTGADAIHPGYGFLAEREWFARAVRDAKIAWVGPSAEAIAALGSKIAARALAVANGVPVVPGTNEPLESAKQAEKVAKKFGYPVLLKAAAGGGGKGMRVVSASTELAGALDAARREAKNAFGDDAVYLEKFVERPRHVEIQVLADSHGTVLSLGERECSVQRRHQKMIEEAPSVAVTPELRQKMGDSAIRVMRAAGYVNAGTCEFLLDQSGNFYFLEVNTRIQVEHPVTELVTGIDLVQWQLRVAAGERLPFSQAEISPRGWSIECRLTSEDASNNFLPSTGRVTHLNLPSGPGVRWDGGIESGSEVGLYYDPMLGKLIVWGADREQAVTRMRRALVDLIIQGIETSRDFHIRLMDDEEFRRGAIDIQWLERRLDSILRRKPAADSVRVAAVVAALLAQRDRAARTVSNSSDGAVGVEQSGEVAGGRDSWKTVGRAEGLRG